MNKYKDKKYYKNRRVYTRRLSNFKVLLLLLVSLIIIYKVAFTPGKHEPKQLHDQPNYAKLEPCSATLCNSKSKCTKLSSNIPYGPSSFAQDGLHLDLSTVHVSVGCQLDVKTQDEETVSLSDGQTYCGDGEKDTKCKNAVNVELKCKHI